MKHGMLIGELSRQFDIPPQTVRYYEKIGLLDPPKRTDAKYRMYLEEDVKRMRFILQAKRFGLSLDEIRDLIKIRIEGKTPCKHLSSLLKRHLEDLEVRIQQMIEFRDALALRYRKIQQTDLDDDCEGTICKYIEQETLN